MLCIYADWKEIDAKIVYFYRSSGGKWGSGGLLPENCCGSNLLNVEKHLLQNGI